MADERERTVTHIPKQRIRAMAVLTVLALALFAVMLVAFEPDAIMWFLAALMLASAAAFWISYFLARRRAR
ncbi:hypothetical protein [Prauserella muralis]|uniref:Uncharacterized protein n=1 Tax=Prauserella muralis TaxID=588067 RepID=A0A2V4ANU4_9PSEU|nr:hypothetical protein [Prauserella muralis]PXY22247.1 hypothetical protein BAY60_20400 [Prauserella muralis]TWE27882.1 hypothetical protein FHX69_0531 [Prauserella muralis]